MASDNRLFVFIEPQNYFFLFFRIVVYLCHGVVHKAYACASAKCEMLEKHTMFRLYKSVIRFRIGKIMLHISTGTNI